MKRPGPAESIMFSLLCCVGMSGCGGSGEHAPVATTAVQDANAVSPADRTPVSPDAGSVDASLVANPAVAEAARLFDSLVHPGLTSEQWEQSHEALLHLGAPAVQVLAHKLTSGTDAERELAATTLVLLGPDAVGAKAELVSALEDDSLFVRGNAAATLIQFPEGGDVAIPALAKLLLADDPQLRQLAAVNLNSAGVAPASQLDVLKQALAQEKSADVLAPVVELLGRIGPPAESALPELQKIAFEQPGDLGAAAQSAIHLITGEEKAP